MHIYNTYYMFISILLYAYTPKYMYNVTHTIPHHTIPYHTMHYITLHCIALHCIALHSLHSFIHTLQYSTLQYSTVHYSTAHDITLHTYIQQTKCKQANTLQLKNQRIHLRAAQAAAMRSGPGCSRAATRPEPPWSRPRYKALRQFIERSNHRRLVRKVLLISMVLLV